MSKSPYEVLGVGKDATSEEITEAFRKQARKLHPDAGGKGSSSEFAELSESRALLANPKARARYDKTGEAVDPVDNDLATAIGRIMNFVGEAISFAEQNKLDPAKIDIIAFANERARDVIRTFRKNIDNERRKARTLRRVAKRIQIRKKKTNMIAKALRAEADASDRSIAVSEEEIREASILLEILQDYSFKPIEDEDFLFLGTDDEE